MQDDLAFFDEVQKDIEAFDVEAKSAEWAFELENDDDAFFSDAIPSASIAPIVEPTFFDGVDTTPVQLEPPTDATEAFFDDVEDSPTSHSQAELTTEPPEQPATQVDKPEKRRPRPRPKSIKLEPKLRDGPIIDVDFETVEAPAASDEAPPLRQQERPPPSPSENKPVEPASPAKAAEPAAAPPPYDATAAELLRKRQEKLERRAARKAEAARKKRERRDAAKEKSAAAKADESADTAPSTPASEGIIVIHEPSIEMPNVVAMIGDPDVRLAEIKKTEDDTGKAVLGMMLVIGTLLLLWFLGG